MKVAILAYAALQFGNYYYVTQLARELRKRGVYVEIFRSPLHIKFFGPSISYLRYFLMNNSLKKFDVIHSSECAGVAVMHQNIVETCHHDYRTNMTGVLFSLLENVACRKAKRIIVPSYATLNRLLRYGFPKDKVRVIYHGVDHEIFRPNKNLREKIRTKYEIEGFTLISVGQLIKRKRHIDILNALLHMDKRKELTLILVGHGPERNNILSLAKKYDIKILHFNRVPRNVLVALYNASDVYVHTSVLEGFGMTVLEAMSCGLPVIAYETADFSKIVGNAGFILKQGDILKLKETVELLWHDEKLRRRLRSEALKQSSKFTWKESALKHIQLYKEILENDY